jgi:hypothetical protein
MLLLLPNWKVEQRAVAAEEKAASTHRSNLELRTLLEKRSKVRTCRIDSAKTGGRGKKGGDMHVGVGMILRDIASHTIGTRTGAAQARKTGGQSEGAHGLIIKAALLHFHCSPFDSLDSSPPTLILS